MKVNYNPKLLSCLANFCPEGVCTVQKKRMGNIRSVQLSRQKKGILHMTKLSIRGKTLLMNNQNVFLVVQNEKSIKEVMN